MGAVCGTGSSLIFWALPSETRTSRRQTDRESEGGGELGALKYSQIQQIGAEEKKISLSQSPGTVASFFSPPSLFPLALFALLFFFLFLIQHGAHHSPPQPICLFNDNAKTRLPAVEVFGDAEASVVREREEP